jgi:hypothetical protein
MTKITSGVFPVNALKIEVQITGHTYTEIADMESANISLSFS